MRLGPSDARVERPRDPGCLSVMPRLRFSLLTATLLITIAAMAIVIALLWREVGPLRAQVKSMRTELGMLNVDDPTRVHVIQIGTSEEHHNKWRIYLPPGGSYSLCAYGRLIPPDPNGQAQQDWFTSVKQNGSVMTDSLDSG